jgi:hypothetical protein
VPKIDRYVIRCYPYICISSQGAVGVTNKNIHIYVFDARNAVAIDFSTTRFVDTHVVFIQKCIVNFYVFTYLNHFISIVFDEQLVCDCCYVIYGKQI